MTKLNYYLCKVYFSYNENGRNINRDTEPKSNKVIALSLVNVLFTDFLAVVQSAGAGGGLFASTDAVMLRHHKPPGDRLPVAAALWRLAPGHHVLDARSIQPAAAQTSATGHAAKPPNTNKQHCAGLAPSDVQLNS